MIEKILIIVIDTTNTTTWVGELQGNATIADAFHTKFVISLDSKAPAYISRIHGAVDYNSDKFLLRNATIDFSPSVVINSCATSSNTKAPSYGNGILTLPELSDDNKNITFLVSISAYSFSS